MDSESCCCQSGLIVVQVFHINYFNRDQLALVRLPFIDREYFTSAAQLTFAIRLGRGVFAGENALRSKRQ